MVNIECVDTIKCILLDKDNHYFAYVICPHYIHSYIFLFKDYDNIRNKIKDKIREIYGEDVQFISPHFKDIITIK